MSTPNPTPDQPYAQEPPPYGSQPVWGPPAPPPLRPQEERTWGAMAHLLTLPAMLIAMAFMAPLIILLLWGNRSEWVRRQAVESLNFQITALIFVAVSVLGGILTLGLGFLVVIPLWLVYAVFWLVCVLLATAAANRGEDYRYPLNIRLVR